MKLTPEARDNLAAQIALHQAELGMSFAEIARSAKVDPAQVARICQGTFKTASANLMQICLTLGVESQHLPIETESTDTHQRRLEAGIIEIWDRTPQDARRILKLLRQLAELRRTG